jgi:hypothetical protein
MMLPEGWAVSANDWHWDRKQQQKRAPGKVVI